MGLMVIFLMVSMQETVSAQEKEDTRPYVYCMEFQIPWSRIDSLEKMINVFVTKYNWVEKAKEMGFILDQRAYIHDTGSEWNYRIEWVYPSWEAMGKTGWGMKVWEVVEPDTAIREAYFDGLDWVYKDVIHRDNIYRLMGGGR